MGGGPSKENLDDISGQPYSIPDNATGCYGTACNTPLSKIVDNHVSETTNDFFADTEQKLNSNQFNTNSVDVDCEGDGAQELEEKLMDSGVYAAATAAGTKITWCALPGYCGTSNFDLDINSNQETSLKNITQYSPETGTTDSTNIGAIVSNSTQFMDSSILGNTEGPKNLQQMANIDLEGQDISEQNASITSLIDINTSQTNAQKINLVTKSLTATANLGMDQCLQNNISLHNISKQKMGVANTLGNSAALSSAQSQGVTVDAQNKDETTHHNTNLNDALDTVGGVVNHLADDVNNIIGNDVAGDLETGWMATMILPCVGIALVCLVICIGVSVVRKHREKKAEKAQATTQNQDSPQVDNNQQIVQSAGSVIKCIDDIKLKNEQLIIIIIIILLIYNIYNDHR